jgi:O-antigen/teichoic acid export membrane protein
MKGEDNFNHILKFFAKSSIIVFIGIFFSKILTYLYKIVVAREFGQEVYGIFSLAIMVSSFFVSFFSLGLQNGLLRYISFYRGKNEPKKIRALLSFSAIITSIASIFAAGLLFIFAEFISVSLFHAPELTIFLKWFAVFLPVFIFAEFFHIITLAYERIGWYSFIGNILPQAVQLSFLSIFIIIGINSEGIPISYSLGLLAVLLSSFFVSKHILGRIFKKGHENSEEDKSLNKELVLYSLPMMFLGLANAIFSWVDTFTIGYFKTPIEVGIYNAALPISYLLLITPVLFLQLFLPIITKEYSKKNFSVIKSLSKQVGKWIFVFNLPLLIIMLLFPGAVINLLFGAEYLRAETALRFLSLGIFFFSFTQISENLLSMLGKSKRILFNLIIAAIINVILNVILIPKYGIDGAAFSTMLGYILWSSLSLISAKHYTSIIPFKREVIKIFFISLIPTAILLYVRSQIVLSIVSVFLLGTGFVAMYFALIFLTHSLDRNDLMILSAIKKKLKNKN